MMMNSVAVSTLLPVAVQIQEAFELSSILPVNICAMSFNIMTIALTFAVIKLNDSYSLETLLRVASGLQLAGMLIRNLTVFNDEFWP